MTKSVYLFIYYFIFLSNTYRATNNNSLNKLPAGYETVADP